jgi:hypothetical protein
MREHARQRFVSLCLAAAVLALVVATPALADPGAATPAISPGTDAPSTDAASDPLPRSPRRTTLWVAPGGNDAWPGTPDQPFATLERARDAVRTLPQDLRMHHDVTVYLRDGQFRLDGPLTLRPQDSGQGGHNVIYRAAPGEHPVVSASTRIPGASWEPWLFGVWRAPVGDVQSRQLYVDGVRATRARTAAWPLGYHPQWSASAANSGIAFDALAEGDPASWTNVGDIEAVNLAQWKMTRVPLSAIATTGSGNGLITLQQPGWDNANVFLDATTYEPGIWSFSQVTWFENALQFLDQPGEWYLDRSEHYLYYIPRSGEVLPLADVELPTGVGLVDGRGTAAHPLSHIRFEGLDFAYATWLQPNGPSGYVDDQSGFHLVGDGYAPNVVGHVQGDEATPGNVSFRYAHDITIEGNIFEHLGAAGLNLGTGSQDNKVRNNLFTDISSAAIQVGGISPVDAHPSRAAQLTRDNVISDNLVSDIGREFIDVAAIYAGFSRHTVITHNTIVNVPWTGIALGWGWGLLDPSGFLGLPGATKGMWGKYDEPTPNRDSVVAGNRIDHFLQGGLWDGGAIYTTGQQGTSPDNGLRIQGNVASGKTEIIRADGLPGIPGGNTFYTDGGTRFVTVRRNVSFDNPVGNVYLGPLSPANLVPYGSDSGGCRTDGDIRFIGNTWFQDPFRQQVGGYNLTYQTLMGFAAYSNEGFFNICPYTDPKGVVHPTNLTYQDNQIMPGTASAPARIVDDAGVRGRPATIPADRWILPLPGP